MSLPPTWAIAVSQYFAYHSLRRWHPNKRLPFSPSEPLPARIARLRAAWGQSSTARMETVPDLMRAVVDNGPALTSKAHDLFVDLALALAVDNDVYFRFPEIDLSHRRTAAEADALVERLVEIETRIVHEREIQTEYARVIATVLDALIPQDIAEPGSFQVPLFEFAGARTFVNAILDRCLNALTPPTSIAALAFQATRVQLWMNVAAASNLTPEQLIEQPHRAVYPDDTKEDGADLIHRYLAGTPFLELALTPLPFSIPPPSSRSTARSSHRPAAARPRRCKRSSSISQIRRLPGHVHHGQHGRDAQKDRAAGEFFTTTLKDSLVILDPPTVPPALNFFKLEGGSPAQQMELFFYLFKAIEQGLTPRQATMVAYLVELMQAIERHARYIAGGVRETSSSAYTERIATPPPITQDFFNNQFYRSRSNSSRKPSNRSPRGSTPFGRNHRVFNAMFSAPTNNFNAYDCMQEKKIVLINTDRLFSRRRGSAIFGRYIIAQCLAARHSPARHTRAADANSPLLIVDEGKQYLDDQAEKILSDARQFGLGTAARDTEPASTARRRAPEIATNTSIKMLGPVSYYQPPSQLARDMHTTTQFIQSMQAYDRSAHRVRLTYVRNFTPHAVKLSIPMGTLEAEPTMSEAEHRRPARRQPRRATAARTAALPPPDHET